MKCYSLFFFFFYENVFRMKHLASVIFCPEDGLSKNKKKFFLCWHIIMNKKKKDLQNSLYSHTKYRVIIKNNYLKPKKNV